MISLRKIHIFVVVETILITHLHVPFIFLIVVVDFPYLIEAMLMNFYPSLCIGNIVLRRPLSRISFIIFSNAIAFAQGTGGWENLACQQKNARYKVANQRYEPSIPPHSELEAPRTVEMLLSVLLYSTNLLLFVLLDRPTK